jgi:hypothetical protein
MGKDLFIDEGFCPAAAFPAAGFQAETLTSAEVEAISGLAVPQLGQLKRNSQRLNKRALG